MDKIDALDNGNFPLIFLEVILDCLKRKRDHSSVYYALIIL